MVSRNCDYITTLLLTLFFGAFGGQYFYTRQYGMAILEIVVCLITCGFGGVIWQIVDIVRVCGGSFLTKEGTVLSNHPRML